MSYIVWSPSKLEQLSRLWKAGVPVWEIAGDFGKTKNGISSIIAKYRKLGLDFPQRNGHERYKGQGVDERMIRMRDQRVPYHKMSRILSIPINTLKKRVGQLRAKARAAHPKAKPKTMPRACIGHLCKGKFFPSTGIGNRMCERCRGYAAGVCEAHGAIML